MLNGLCGGRRAFLGFFSLVWYHLKSTWLTKSGIWHLRLLIMQLLFIFSHFLIYLLKHHVRFKSLSGFFAIAAFWKPAPLSTSAEENWLKPCLAYEFWYKLFYPTFLAIYHIKYTYHSTIWRTTVRLNLDFAQETSKYAHLLTHLFIFLKKELIFMPRSSDIMALHVLSRHTKQSGINPEGFNVPVMQTKLVDGIKYHIISYTNDMIHTSSILIWAVTYPI